MTVEKTGLLKKSYTKTLIRSLESDLKDVRDKSMVIDSAIIGQKMFITESLYVLKLSVMF